MKKGEPFYLENAILATEFYCIAFCVMSLEEWMVCNIQSIEMNYMRVCWAWTLLENYLTACKWMKRVVAVALLYFDGSIDYVECFARRRRCRRVHMFRFSVRSRSRFVFILP